MDSAEALDRVPPAEAAEAAFLVGIGSSAGGLEALSALLPTLPTGLGLGYLIAQHMSPTHRSMMAQLMGRLTPMTVLEAGNGCRPQADTVLVVPPNHHAVLLPDGSLQLTESPARPAPKPSVNRLFFSLADVLGDRAIGVVLSGTGSDGALGLHAIKAAGGYTFAQEPGGTKYEGMPRAAIEAGGVDWVLPADGIGTEIARLVTRRQSTAEAAGEAGGTSLPGDRLNALLGSLYAHTRIDFHGYKEATLWRRVERRMAANGCADLELYLALCRERPSELQALAQDMLISVTAFFRDRPAFERLREALDRLLAVKPAGEDVRIWVAGCASGEEAYSLAICLQEALRAAGQTRRVHLFASDIDENALQRARRGVYPAGLLADLDADWLERYFERHAEGYEVHKALRSQVMFARHNLVQDAPFARLDLVSCRNVLIYLQPMLQERVLRTFQYALNPGGLLFLGRSEGLHNQDSRFETLDRSAHLFRRSATLQRLSAPGAEADPPRASPGRTRNSLDDLVLRATQERFAPASVLVDLAGEVRHFKGDLGGLMAWPEGRPGFQLMGLLRRELRPEASRLIRSVNEALKAPADGPRRPFGGPPMLGRWRLNQAISSDWALRLSAQPVYDDSGSALILLCFERRPAQELPGGPGSERDEPANGHSAALEEALSSTREHLYTVIEQLEASNEAAQALNEEIQTTNEELQSTNQELEAANEELQASNEELSTVNEELLAKSAEWQAMAAELEGIYATMECALLAFDNRLVLTRLNRAAQVHLGIDPAWLGTPLASLPWPDGMPSLQTELDLLQQHGRPQTRQITGMGARHWTLRLLPRLGADGARIGVLLQLEDHTRLRDSEEAALRSDARMRQLVQRSTQLVCICDPAGRLLLANPEFERYHRLAGGGAGRLLVELLPAEQAQTFRNAHLEVLRTLGGLEVEEQADLDGSPRDLLATYFPLLDDDGAVSAVCYQALDITRRKQAESDLLAAQSAKLAAEGMARTKASFLANMSHEIRTPMNAVLGLSRMALQEPLPPRAHEQIAHIHEAAHALTRILDDVLDFSKIEAGELQFEQAPFRLDDLLREVRSLFSANAQQKGLALVLDRPLGVPEELVGDSLRLAQVLNNLVGNAIKFTEAGEVRLSVGPLPSPAPGRCRLRFSVRDTGIGVAPGLQDKLFEAFTQGDASVTRRFGGTGLGLAICQRLVALMRGEIGVLSEAGRGSEFWFSAEFALSAAPERAAAADPATPHALADWAGRRVLLAEDNELNQIVGRAVLEQLGLQVEVAAHGAELLDRLSRQPVGHYSAVLMDVHMPVLDGLEATRRLRRLPQGRAIPVIALTAAALSEDRDRCLAAGMDDHIAKPLDPGRLIEALRAVQPERGVRVRPPAPADDPPQVPGFDLQPLFERLQHNRRMVWQLLEEFVEREGVTGDELRRLLSESRVDEARLRVHGLLGSAVTVGATLVSRTAAGLEAALGAGLVSPAMMQSVDEALSMNLAAVREALALRPPADR